MVPFQLSSPDFGPGEHIPKRHTCEGGDAAPTLRWTGTPPGTRSLALIVDDPDAPDPKAPQRTWVHWVVLGIPPSVSTLAAGKLPAGAQAGLNDWAKAVYGGPCPPMGRHRYFFKLYALDAELQGLSTPTKAQLEAAMKGHVLAQAELMGTYRKQ